MRAKRGFVAAFLFAAQMLFASSTWAAHAIPVNTTFTASGPITIDTSSLNVPCYATMVLTTDAAGNVRITQMTFSALSSPLCSIFEAEALPWPVTLNGPFGVALNARLEFQLGSCFGALSMDFWSNTATFSGLWGGCSVTGTLSISPVFSVVTP